MSNPQWQRNDEGLLICGGCFGPIRGAHVTVGALPYHPPATNPGSKRLVWICKPPGGGRGKMNGAAAPGADQLELDLPEAS